MKFCRRCGASLQTTPGSPALGSPFSAPPGPMASPPQVAIGTAGGGVAPGGPIASPRHPSGANTIICPRCATPTPVGFAYCQQCGLHMNAIAPTDPGAVPSRIRPPTNSPPLGSGGMSPPVQLPGVDPQAATLASEGGRAAVVAMRPSTPSSSPVSAVPSSVPTRPSTGPGGSWGTAILVNRDGTDGQRFPLTSEDTIVGRAGADIAFDEDRFLARQHARISRGTDGGIKIHPIDQTNGVFKKTDGSVELADGAILLVGREVLRFEKVTPEERAGQPLVRHGVALFGSPPRDPWARLIQLIPSGGARDIRHLMGEEIVLGREEGDIVYRDDAFMSRRHAAITWDGKRALLTDLGSSNGTFVRMAGPTSIKHGDHVRMGDQLMRIER